MFRASRGLAITLLSSAGLALLPNVPAHGQRRACSAGQAASSTTSTAASTGSAVSQRTLRAATSTASQRSTSQLLLQLDRQITQLQVAQQLVQSGQLAAPQNSGVNTAQLQNQIQIRINQLQTLRTRLSLRR
jgi:hypothetical protein